MQFLEPFIRKRRTMTNLQIKRAPPSVGYSNLQRNYSSNNGRQNKLSCMNVADESNDNDIHIKNMPSMSLPKYTSLQKNFSSNDDKENNLPCMNVTTSDESNDNNVHIKSMPLARYYSLQNSNDDKENNLPCMNIATLEKNNNDVCVKNMLPSARYSSQKNFGSNGNQNNLSSVATSIEQSPADISNVDSRQYAFKELSPKSGNSRRAVSQILSPSTEFQERSTRKDVQTKSKGKSQPDFLQNAVCKVTSLLENRSTTSLLSSFNSEIPEDVAFCQLILSLLKNMLQSEKTQKKEILRIMYDL
ncbi:PREDICTED: putative uncharacterized protein DDB_G0282133 [Trachymyrmex cornetzi]|uniref:putative uncharacterized protein DDB_G0282133 n=1 Tax=Trachymyrmex cornetzi TaxID=471704 RepID=UPI00084F0994|nr:PREDICTED: putative uncharacterized protein DDB_G0282133 [Trachymyrmex cornetzi]